MSVFVLYTHISPARAVVFTDSAGSRSLVLIFIPRSVFLSLLQHQTCLRLTGSHNYRDPAWTVDGQLILSMSNRQNYSHEDEQKGLLELGNGTRHRTVR